MMEMGIDRIMFSVDYPFAPNMQGTEWMENISLQGKANFFEHRVDQYQKANVMTSVEGEHDGFENYVFRTDVDF